MNAEIIGVGTELLLGQIVNTNAAYIARALADIGVDVYFHTVVGDNPVRMAQAISQAVGRSDAVVITGGLGPTPYDITREGIADALGVGLRRDEGLVQVVSGIFTALGRDMPETNLRQADLPEGAVPIRPEGTAPGFVMESEGAVVFALPGVPWEMKAMMTKSVVPELARRAGGSATISREVLVIGLGESATHERIADIVEAQTNPTIAYRASGGQVSVRLTAKAGARSEADALIAPIEAEVRKRLGDAAVPGNHASIAAALTEGLKEAGATVGVAESLTGGLIAAELTGIPGSSAVFQGSLVCYSDSVKAGVAHLDPKILRGPGAVSPEAAAALAEAAATILEADLGLSATGVAGPDELEGKPVGTVFVAARWSGSTQTRSLRAPRGDRSYIRDYTTTSALDLGRRVMARPQA